MKWPFRHLFILLAAPVLWGCTRTIVPDIPTPEHPEWEYGRIPAACEGLPRVYIYIPGQGSIDSKREWTQNVSIRIEATVNGDTVEVYRSDSLKIKGHGNTTWESYPKKPYSLKLKHKVNFLGTGKTSRWILLANWMDRTHLRNDVAFEAARRTKMEWAPSGTFVKLFLNGDSPFDYQGLYWLGERIHVEGSNFLADYLYSYDTSDPEEVDMLTLYGRRRNDATDGEIPVELKYPDRDQYSAAEFQAILSQAETVLHDFETSLYKPDEWQKGIDLDSFCDWFLVNELCYNLEPAYPKSSFFYYRDGKMFAGPVWDFDWGTFTWDDEGASYYNLNLRPAIYYHQLCPQPAFVKRLKERWKSLKPQFTSLTTYIDQRADLIREEDDNYLWPCYPNPLSEEESGLVNFDENLSFDEAVQLMKKNLLLRIGALDTAIRNLQ
ncbi:MAG: CotH kinase family protein [Bacteroidales bacterium]|nr:CotH kinase family protein [Bacteroidales bacterium]